MIDLWTILFCLHIEKEIEHKLEIILSIVYILGYEEKCCYICFIYFYIIFLFLPYDTMLAGNNLFH